MAARVHYSQVGSLKNIYIKGSVHLNPKNTFSYLPLVVLSHADSYGDLPHYPNAIEVYEIAFLGLTVLKIDIKEYNSNISFQKQWLDY